MKCPDGAIIVGALLLLVGIIQTGNGVLSSDVITVIFGLCIPATGGIFLASQLTDLYEQVCYLQ